MDTHAHAFAGCGGCLKAGFRGRGRRKGTPAERGAHSFRYEQTSPPPPPFPAVSLFASLNPALVPCRIASQSLQARAAAEEEKKQLLETARAEGKRDAEKERERHAPVIRHRKSVSPRKRTQRHPSRLRVHHSGDALPSGTQPFAAQQLMRSPGGVSLHRRVLSEARAEARTEAEKEAAKVKAEAAAAARAELTKETEALRKDMRARVVRVIRV